MSRGTVIEIGGKTRRLRYDLNAWAEIGDRLNIRFRPARLMEDLREVGDTPMSPAALRTVLWAGLIHEDATLTEHEVGSWVDFDTAPAVARGFFEHLSEILEGLAQEAEKAGEAMRQVVGETNEAA